MTDEELKHLFEGVRGENAAAHLETRRRFDQWDERFGRIDERFQRADERFDETRRHFDVVVERMEKRFDSLAESVAALDEKLDRKIEDLDERMRRGFEETQAMIKFSHAELDRRVRALEQGFGDLQARVERLESTTH